MSGRSRPCFPFPLLRLWFMRLVPVWFGIALVIFLMQLAVCGIIHDNESVKTMMGFIDMLPSIVKAAMGGDALEVGNLSGLIAIGYNHPLVLILFMLFAVGTPTGMLAGEVQRGTMELILSRGATKTQVYICAGLLTMAGMFALVIVMYTGTVVATNIYDFGEPIPLYPFLQTAINGGLLASSVGAISLLMAAIFRRRGTAVGVSVGYLVVSYFVSIITEWWPRMKFLEPWTIFNYVDFHKIFADHVWPVNEIFVLVLITVSAFVAGAIIWQRRDLPL